VTCVSLNAPKNTPLHSGISRADAEPSAKTGRNPPTPREEFAHFFLFGAQFLYYRARGGYKAVEIGGH
jgi:hypothetical protein